MIVFIYRYNKTVGMIAVITALASCSSSSVQGTEGMLGYAIQQHGEGLEFSGSVSDAGETLAWFSFDEANPTCSYMIFKNKGNYEYEPLSDPNYTMNAGACHCIWHKGVAVHVENEDVKEVQVVSGKTVTFPVDAYPFNIYTECYGSETYVFFLDENENIIEKL